LKNRNRYRSGLLETAARKQCRLDLFGSELGPVADPFEHGNEFWGFVKGREFVEEMNGCKLLKRL
jgi:hypothetical protein